MQSHLLKMGKDGAIYKKASEEQKNHNSKIKNMLAFLHLLIVNRICSLHSDVVYSFLHVRGLKNTKKHSEYAKYSKEVLLQ